MTVISETSSAPIIALMGGSFDPVHRGHLLTALAAKQALGADEMRLLPCAQSPLKARAAASALQRESMLALALLEYPQLSLDTRELHQPGPTYTVDTLQQCRREWGVAARIVFVIGWDALQSLTRWHRWRNVLENAHLAVMTRPGFTGYGSGPASQELITFVMDKCVDTVDLCSQPSGHMTFISVPEVDISSTEVRAKLADGKQVTSMIPDVVQQYIIKHELYL